MKTGADIKALAVERLLDTECLFNNGRHDAAYYIAGYVVELYLKARVCITSGIEDFFDFNNPNKRKLKNNGGLYRPFKVDGVEQLVVLPGIFTVFESEIIDNNDFKSAWSVIKNWNENARYLTGRSISDAESLLIAIKIFEQWIIKYL